jgi:hypothetical protein
MKKYCMPKVKLERPSTAVDLANPAYVVVVVVVVVDVHISCNFF